MKNERVRNDEEARLAQEYLKRGRNIAAEATGEGNEGYELYILNNEAANVGVKIIIRQIAGAPGHYEAISRNLVGWQD